MDLWTSHVVSAVGVTLVHFVWQGAAIGLVTAAVLATCPRALASTRYVIAGAGLLSMTAAPVATLLLLWPATNPVGAGPAVPAAAATAEAAAALAAALPTALAPWLPTAVSVWAIGVLILTLRLVVAWIRTEHVRRRDLQPVGEGLARAVRRLADVLGIRRPVSLFESRRVDVPTVIGWLRPTILLPVGALTGLSVQQIEAVLSHELAHIRRHDYLVNALQNLAETVFFYHPAVWWLSARIRIEREHCCDDVAVEACGDPVLYARALTALEESRQQQRAFALAATDGSLVARVRRLVGPARDDRREPSLPIAVCVGVILAVLAIGGAQARAQDPGPATDAPAVEGIRVAWPDGSSLTLPAAAENWRAEGRFTFGAEPAPQVTAAPESAAAAQDVRPDAVAPDLPRPIPVYSEQVAPAPPPPPNRPIRIGGDIREPRKIHHVDPIYPDAAREAGASGVVILEATIDPEGVPVDIRILRSIPALDQAAINAVRQWRYTPTLLNGKPVAVVMTVTVNFTLRQSEAEIEARLEVLRQQLETMRTEAAPGQELDRLARELELLRARVEAMRAVRAREQNPQTMTAPTPAPGGAVRVGGDIAEPRKIRHVNPVYPANAREAQVSGVVIMTIIIDTEGNVTDVVVLRSVPMLDEAAVLAVRQWKYAPTLVNGVPTPVQMTVTMNFTLN